MEPLAAGAVVLVPFPFSDLSQAKLRPAVVLADVGRGDFILCQVTSNPYADLSAIELTEASFDHPHFPDLLAFHGRSFDDFAAWSPSLN